MRKLLLVLFFAFFAIPSLMAQAKPEPYGQDEFPQWLQDLRRAEIITIGSLPLTLYACNMGYSFYRWGVNDFDGLHSFDFLGNSPTPLTPEERLGILGTALGMSLSISLTDFIITKVTDASK